MSRFPFLFPVSSSEKLRARATPRSLFLQLAEISARFDVYCLNYVFNSKRPLWARLKLFLVNILSLIFPSHVGREPFHPLIQMEKLRLSEQKGLPQAHRVSGGEMGFEPMLVRFQTQPSTTRSPLVQSCQGPVSVLVNDQTPPQPTLESGDGCQWDQKDQHEGGNKSEPPPQGGALSEPSPLVP